MNEIRKQIVKAANNKCQSKERKKENGPAYPIDFLLLSFFFAISLFNSHCFSNYLPTTYLPYFIFDCWNFGVEALATEKVRTLTSANRPGGSEEYCCSAIRDSAPPPPFDNQKLSHLFDFENDPDIEAENNTKKKKKR